MKKILLLKLSFFFVLFALISSAQTLTFSGLVARYPMNSVSGSVMTDSSGNANNGTFTSGVIFTGGRLGTSTGAAAILGYKDSFGDYASVSTPSISSLTGFTIAFWFKPLQTITATGASGLVKLISLSNGMNEGYDLYLQGGATNRLVFYNSTTFGAALSTLAGAATLTANSWQHISLSADPATGKVQLYYNGSKTAETTLTGLNNPSNKTLYIGRGSAIAPYFNAYDDVNVYGRVLTSTELKSIYSYCTIAVPTVTSSVLCGSGMATLTGMGGTTYRWYADSLSTTVLQTTSGTFITPQLTTTTSYWVSSLNGCESKKVKVTVNVVNKPIIAVRDTLFDDGINSKYNWNVIEIVNLDTSAIYSWIYSINGLGKDSLKFGLYQNGGGKIYSKYISFDGTKNRKLKYIYTINIFGCEASDSVIVKSGYFGLIATIPSSIVNYDIADNNSVTLFPNPVIYEFEILNLGKCQPIIYGTNLQGEIVLAEQKYVDKISVSNLPSGIYQLHILSEGKRFIKQFVKE